MSDGIHANVPNISRYVLDHYLFDHRHVLLKDMDLKYSPTFSAYSIIGFYDDFSKVMQESWKNGKVGDLNGMVSFEKWLRFLKNKLKCWCG